MPLHWTCPRWQEGVTCLQGSPHTTWLLPGKPLHACLSAPMLPPVHSFSVHCFFSRTVLVPEGRAVLLPPYSTYLPSPGGLSFSFTAALHYSLQVLYSCISSLHLYRLCLHSTCHSHCPSHLFPCCHFGETHAHLCIYHPASGSVTGVAVSW